MKYRWIATGKMQQNLKSLITSSNLYSGRYLSKSAYCHVLDNIVESKLRLMVSCSLILKIHECIFILFCCRHSAKHFSTTIQMLALSWHCFLSGILHIFHGNLVASTSAQLSTGKHVAPLRFSKLFGVGDSTMVRP